MGTCGTCRWWGLHPDEDARYCRVIAHADGWLFGREVAADELAWTSDRENHGSNLITRADFGCVLHEARDGVAAE